MRRGFDNSGLAIVLAASVSLIMASSKARTNASPPRTREQIAAADKRSERQKWNDEVAQRKTDKQAAKQKATS